MAQSRTLKTREFDAANYVEVPADVAGYLELVMEEKADPEELASALNIILRSRGGKAVSLEAFVDMLDVVGLRMRVEPA